MSRQEQTYECRNAKIYEYDTKLLEWLPPPFNGSSPVQEDYEHVITSPSVQSTHTFCTFARAARARLSSNRRRHAQEVNGSGNERRLEFNVGLYLDLEHQGIWGGFA